MRKHSEHLHPDCTEFVTIYIWRTTSLVTAAMLLICCVCFEDVLMQSQWLLARSRIRTDVSGFCESIKANLQSSLGAAFGSTKNVLASIWQQLDCDDKCGKCVMLSLEFELDDQPPHFYKSICISPSSTQRFSYSHLA